MKACLFAVIALLLLPMGAGARELPPFYAAMTAPMAPFRISDDIYYVGAHDVTSFLIVTDKGLILTDGGFEETAPQIEANIATVGFDIHDVKILLNSHAHFDHAGGLAALKQASGATFYASGGDAPVLESGGLKSFADFGPLGHFPPVKVDRIVRDGEKIALGHTVLIMHLTPGHTKGCTSWSMTTTVKRVPENVLFICSLSVLSQYRLLSEPGYPNMASDYAMSFRKLKALPCDVFIASHGQFFDLVRKRALLDTNPPQNPFVDPQGCRTFLNQEQAAYETELAKERGQSPAAH
jgi:metallo-beta-lactamase class B